MAKKVLISGLGTAVGFSNLNKADFKFNDRGIWKGQIAIRNDDPRCQQMIDAIVALHEEDYEKRLAEYKKNPPKPKAGSRTKPTEPYAGDLPFMANEDGTTTFFFKSYATYLKDGETKELPLHIFDSKGKKIAQPPLITSGSKLKFKYSMVPYGWTAVAGASVKLQLEGVMLVELAEFGGADGGWGDETEEGGYVAGEQREESFDDNTQADDDDASTDDSGDF